MTTQRKRNEEERLIVPNGTHTIQARGKLGAIVSFPVLVANNNNMYEEKTFERFVRPPGTRMIVVQKGKILLQKEYRIETGTEDWRLPGGKVFDTFEEYEKYIGKEIPESFILNAGIRELREEAKLDAKEISIISKSICGATIEWDLYYLFVENFLILSEYTNNETEEILGHEWKTFEEVLELCKIGSIGEDRTVAFLYRFLNSQ